jgi:large subunit ribosomal protein L14
MIQIGTFLNVIDNSGARNVATIKILGGYKRRYAYVGDTILISVKNIRSKRRFSSKTKKGEIYKALIVKTKNKSKTFNGDSIQFLENSVVLLNKQNKLVGTRVFGSVSKKLRYTKFLRVVSLSYFYLR